MQYAHPVRMTRTSEPCCLPQHVPVLGCPALGGKRPRPQQPAWRGRSAGFSSAPEHVKQTRATEQGILPSDSHPCVGVHSLTLVHGNHSCADTGRRRASLATSSGQHGSGLGTWSSVRVANRTQSSGELTAYPIVLFSVPVGLSDFSLLEVNEG